MIPVIRNMEQLKAEQRRLEERKKFLEAGISSKLNEIKEQFRPRVNAAAFFTKIFGGKKEEMKTEDWLADTMADLAAKFAKKYTAKAEEKIKTWFTK